MELYRKHRPKTFEEMQGNKSVIDTLQSQIEKNKLPHCLLLTGPSGTGKTTIGRILKTVLKADDDFGYKEIDTTIYNKLDDAKDVSKNLTQYPPLKGNTRVVVLDEIHMLGQGGNSPKNKAQNALLKTLENCPEWCYFVLCTTNPEMLIPTIKSRCTQYELNTLSGSDCKKLLIKTYKKEKIRPNKAHIDLIIKYSEGHPRAALQMLGKVIDITDPDKAKKLLEEEKIKENKINELCYALLDGKKWNEIKKILNGLQKEQPETIRRGILGMMNSALLNGWGDRKRVQPWYIMSWFYDKTTYDSGMPGITFCCKAVCQQEEVY